MRLIKKLPDPFLLSDGSRVNNLSDWHRRRTEIRDMMLGIQYGTMPGAPEIASVDAGEEEVQEGGATRQELKMEFTPYRNRRDISFGMDVTLWRPSSEAIDRRKKEVAGFGEQGLPALVYVGGRVFRNVLESGIVTLCFENNQLEPMEMGNAIVGPARSAYRELEPGVNSWGSISVWAWGARRVLEYALSLPDVNSDQICVSGHSRIG